MTPATPLLQMNDLGVTYRTSDGEFAAVRDVNLTLHAGETLGIAGESGSGKSTVAMSVLRLLPKTATVTGQVLLDGEDVNTMRWGRLRAVRWSSASIVFQGAMHALNPVRTIGEQIAEPLRLHTTTNGSTKDRVAELLRQVDLPPERVNAYPHELSGGQKQRVMIAMALACEPKLIVADEPTTALDVVVQDQVLQLVSRLVTERGIGLIMISHDLAVLAQTCARIAVMYRGRIVEEGTSAEVFGQPRHEHTRALADAIHQVGDPQARMVTGEASVRNLSGPVTIARAANASAKRGADWFLYFLALLSLSLAIINLLPIPILDGGHLLYYLIELVKGSPLSERAMAAGQYVGLALLAGLMGLAFYNDILGLFSR